MTMGSVPSTAKAETRKNERSHLRIRGKRDSGLASTDRLHQRFVFDMPKRIQKTEAKES